MPSWVCRQINHKSSLNSKASISIFIKEINTINSLSGLWENIVKLNDNLFWVKDDEIVEIQIKGDDNKIANSFKM